VKIYVDGENFRHGIVKILQEGNLIKDSRAIGVFPLRQLLEDALASKELSIAYYASKVKLPYGYEPTPQIIARANLIKNFNRTWVAQLTAQKIGYIKAGYLKVKSSEPCPNCNYQQEVLQEKGVDVRIAVDLITDSHTSRKTIALMSSDSDLIPALGRIKNSGVKIIYICFADMVNKAISSTADETVAISTAKVQQIYREANYGK